jgi:DNA-binding response OmpR family regulator
MSATLLAMKRLITLIEDEAAIAEAMGLYLRARGFEFQHYTCAEELLKNPLPRRCIYLVDWNLPGMKGVDLIRQLRGKDPLSPIFMVSGYNQREEVVIGLNAGADDYLTKPFSFEELAVRIENAWSKLNRLEGDLLSHGTTLLPAAHSILRNGVTISLTAREYALFEFLYRGRDKVILREEVLAFFNKAGEDSRNLHVHMHALRKKMQPHGVHIHTLWGTGYRLELSEEAA